MSGVDSPPPADYGGRGGAVKQFDAAIVVNRSIAPSWRQIVVEWDRSAGRPSPGQFFTFRASSSTDPLLRRPLAFAGFEPDTSRASAVYEVRGPATRLLAELAPGSRVDLLGPLGRAFPPLAGGERPLLAGGGIGLGPLLFLAGELAGSGSSQKGDPAESSSAPGPLLGLGFRTAAAVPDLELPPAATICTDDGSRGFHGTVVDWLGGQPPQLARVYACGPAAMLAAIARLVRGRGWTASLSAEQWMACGVGACMGCALPRADGRGYLRVCTDGPVFNSPSPDGAEIDWAAAGPGGRPARNPASENEPGARP